MSETEFQSSDDVRTTTVTEWLTGGWRGSVFGAVTIGFIVGCWVTYVILYPFSTLPFPQYTMVTVLVLGWYINYFARSMLDRLGILMGSSVVAYVTALVGFTLPALVGWYQNPIVRRSLYLQGLKQVFLFTMPAVVLLIVGTLGAYVIGQAYEEVTR